jgi:hypothetical protein
MVLDPELAKYQGRRTRGRNLSKSCTTFQLTSRLMTLYGTQVILAKPRSRTRVRIAGEDILMSLCEVPDG